MYIVFVGGVMLGRLANAALKVEPPEYPWGDTLPIFSGGDVRMCNLECVISDRGKPWSRTPKVFHFRSEAKNIAVLQRAQIDMVSVANNHTLDCDCEAMLDMLHLLDQNAGADLIFGHSGHVFRGIELYQRRPIVYCTGNFIDDYAVDEIERNDQSFIFVAETEKNQIRTLKLYPTVIRNCQARLASSPEREDIVQKMQYLCARLHTQASWQKNDALTVAIG